MPIDAARATRHTCAAKAAPSFVSIPDTCGNSALASANGTTRSRCTTATATA